MSSERGIAAGDHQVVFAGLCRSIPDGRCDILMDLLCLFRRKTAGVRKDVKELFVRAKRLIQGLLCPICIDVDIVNGLAARWVVVEHDDLAVKLCVLFL